MGKNNNKKKGFISQMICNNFTSSFDLSLFMAFPSRESINKKEKKMLLNYDLKARENVRIVRRKERRNKKNIISH